MLNDGDLVMNRCSSTAGTTAGRDSQSKAWMPVGVEVSLRTSSSQVPSVSIASLAGTNFKKPVHSVPEEGALQVNYFNEQGDPVLTCAPDIYGDEPQVEPERNIDAMQALLGVVFELGQWAGRDKVKAFAAYIVMRQSKQSTASFAKENGVSDSYVRRVIRQAQSVIGSARNP